MNWYYRGEPITEANGRFGFVYQITNLKNQKKYIGKKQFWFSVKKKGKRVKVESDWRMYFGSSESLQKDIDVYGYNNFHREILQFGKNKSELSYSEAYFQFVNNVLISDEYYNDWISVKVSRRNLKNTK